MKELDLPLFFVILRFFTLVVLKGGNFKVRVKVLCGGVVGRQDRHREISKVLVFIHIIYC